MATAAIPALVNPPASSADQTQHFLQRIKLFSALSPAECVEVVKRMKRRDFPPSQIIVREGAPGNSMFFITDGLVEVRKRDANTGIDFLLDEMGPGQNFGEMSLLTGKPRTATVMSLQQTTCAVLEQKDFQELILQYPKIGVSLTTILAERLEHATQHVGVEYINLAKMHLDPRVLALVPLAMINQHKVLPVAFANNRLTLAMVNPNNILALDDLRRVIKGVMVEPVVITEDDFRKFMATAYLDLMRKPDAPSALQAGLRVAEATLDALQSELIRGLQVAEDSAAAGPAGETKQDLMSASEDAPIIRLGNSILGLAIKKGASDIHIEPQESSVKIRFRVDGQLQLVQDLPKRVQLGLISRLKILAKLDISEKRLPQDGRISIAMEGKPIDFRVSTVPGKWGETVCMRILDKSNTMLGLELLITHKPTLQMVRDLVNQPYGILYVTGPTGSGKTTTLYSALAEINDASLNITTVEDPIEYDLAGITQVQTNRDIGLDFARVLRSFLRQDPDVILVGETRDRETAQIAVEAALTGHMVFTTLHTNTAAGAFTRLNEMGIEPFLISSSTVGVVAQRLTRRLCACKEPFEADDATCDYMGIRRAPGEKVTLYRRTGCEECSGSGFKGRVGIYEVLKLNQELRSLVSKGAATEEITACALRGGMLDLKAYAAILLREGVTTVEEVLQVVSVAD